MARRFSVSTSPVPKGEGGRKDNHTNTKRMVIFECKSYKVKSCLILKVTNFGDLVDGFIVKV